MNKRGTRDRKDYTRNATTPLKEGMVLYKGKAPLAGGGVQNVCAPLPAVVSVSVEARAWTKAQKLFYKNCFAFWKMTYEYARLENIGWRFAVKKANAVISHQTTIPCDCGPEREVADIIAAKAESFLAINETWRGRSDDFLALLEKRCDAEFGISEKPSADDNTSKWPVVVRKKIKLLEAKR